MLSIQFERYISGLDGHTAISGCPSLLHSFVDTFFELAMVKNLRLYRRLVTLAFRHWSVLSVKMSVEFCQFQKKSISTRVSLHAYQISVHRLAAWLLHFVPSLYPGKRPGPCNSEQKYFWFKNWAGAFVPPNIIRGLNELNGLLRCLAFFLFNLLLFAWRSFQREQNVFGQVVLGQVTRSNDARRRNGSTAGDVD